MSARRFLVDPGELKEGPVELARAEAAHAVKVLRLGPGDPVELLDGQGGRGLGRVEEAGRKGVVCRVESVTREPAPDPPLVMLPGVLKGQAMENVLAKFTELGVNQARPVLAGRSVPKLSDPEGKAARWRGVALQALKQCGGAHATVVRPPAGLEETLAAVPAGAQKIFLYENQDQGGLAEALAERAPGRPIWALVGPEGGIAPQEAQTLVAAGFRPIGLGPRILRAETANIALAALLRLA